MMLADLRKTQKGKFFKENCFIILEVLGSDVDSRTDISRENCYSLSEKYIEV
jgi:hypothetical protein